jgi:hypothetical protein
MSLFAGPGTGASLNGLTTDSITLAAGQTWLVQPAGWYQINPGNSTTFQKLDPITNTWKTIGGSVPNGALSFVYSDGVNYRLANQSGCAVGALLTAAGSGYTAAPTVTASAGSSIWSAIVGGAISTTVTVTNGGTGYTYPPSVIIATPPQGGIPATATATLTAGVVTAVTVVNQGAGYAFPPQIVFVNDPREVNNPSLSTGYGAAAVATLTGAGTITGVLCLDHGTPLTAVPTLTFSGGGGSSAAATAIMNWGITAYAAGTAGAGLAGTVARITAEDAFPTTAAAYTNPSSQSGLVEIRSADIKAPITGGGITATGQVVYDAGVYTSVPTPLVIPSASVATTAPVVTFTMGGVSDTSFIVPR